MDDPVISKTIGLPTSTWASIEKRTKKAGFSNRSQYIKFAIEKQIHKGKLKDKNILGIMILLELTAVMLLLLSMRFL